MLPQITPFKRYHKQHGLVYWDEFSDFEYKDRIDNNTYGLDFNLTDDEDCYDESLMEYMNELKDEESFNKNYDTPEFQNYLDYLDSQTEVPVSAIEYIKNKHNIEYDNGDFSPVEDIVEELLSNEAMREISQYLDKEIEKRKTSVDFANIMINSFNERNNIK